MYSCNQNLMMLEPLHETFMLLQECGCGSRRYQPFAGDPLVAETRLNDISIFSFSVLSEAGFPEFANITCIRTHSELIRTYRFS
jgi:hypothetical protein